MDSGKENVGNIGSRRRVVNKSQYSVEDQALDQIAKEVRCSTNFLVLSYMKCQVFTNPIGPLSFEPEELTGWAKNCRLIHEPVSLVSYGSRMWYISWFS